MPKIKLEGMEISTHALTEGDIVVMFIRASRVYFNSRPHGGRQALTARKRYTKRISTHALTEGDGDGFFAFSCNCMRISTHALTEGDSSISIISISKPHFNSRPHGGRRLYHVFIQFTGIFQLTPSRRATLRGISTLPIKLFQLTPSRRAT